MAGFGGIKSNLVSQMASNNVARMSRDLGMVEEFGVGEGSGEQKLSFLMSNVLG